MKYSAIGYLIGEGFRNIVKNKKSSFASIIIMFMTMLIFGIFFVLGENINSFMNQIQAEQGIRVFLYDVTTDKLKTIEEEIKSIDGVANTTFISKSEALDKMKKSYKEKAFLLDGFDEEVLPMSYTVNLSDLEKSAKVQEEILKMEDVESIESKDDTINGIVTIGKGIRLVTGVFLIILVIISVFIISNTIKLAVHSRRKEISIMKYVGATNSFIRWPFIVEGILIGLISAAISLLVVGGVYNIAINEFITTFSKIIKLTPVSFKEMFDSIIIVYLSLGIGIGTIGSTLSMKKYLEV